MEKIPSWTGALSTTWRRLRRRMVLLLMLLNVMLLWILVFLFVMLASIP